MLRFVIRISTVKFNSVLYLVIFVNIYSIKCSNLTLDTASAYSEQRKMQG